MKEIIQCNLCHNDTFTPLFQSSDRMHNIPGEYRVERCNLCGLIFINPQPDPPDLFKHYPENEYYPHNFSSLKNWLYGVIYTEKSPVFRKLFSPLKLIMRSVKIVQGGNYLDVGCGSGGFMRIVESAGMKAFGVEPAKIGENHLGEKEFNIFHGFLEEAKYPDNFFDLITLNHVLEHTSNPMTTLRELKRILKPKGILIIGVPQSESLAYRLFRENWIQLDVPRHLYTFSYLTLRKYAEVNGFKIDKIRFNSKPLQIYGSFFYLYAKICKKDMYFAESTLLNNPLIKILANLSIFPLAIVLNRLKLGDELEFILIK